MPENLNAIGHHPDPVIREFPRRVLFTDGVPTQRAYEGAPAIDQTTGDIYRYESEVWVLKVSGGGGAGSLEVWAISGSGTPATSIPPAGYKVAFNDDGNFWIKTTLGWEQRF